MGHREGKARSPWEISSGITEEVTAELDLEGKASTYPGGKKTENGKEAEAWRSESKEHQVRPSGVTNVEETLAWHSADPQKGKVKTHTPGLPRTRTAGSLAHLRLMTTLCGKYY